MRTNFTDEQLADPKVREANRIIGTCAHLGFCTNTCPTYVLTRDENESPRGRIDLIRAMLERGAVPDAETVRHLDNCLSCLSCMTTCAVKVDYMHLIDVARVHIEEYYKRRLSERVLRKLLVFGLARPRVMHALLSLSYPVRGVAAVLPTTLRKMFELLPAKRNGFAKPLRAGRYSSGAGIHRVALAAGCVQQVLNGNINGATIRLLQRYGCDVVISEGAGCCGSLALHMGHEKEALALARANITAWNRDMAALGIEAILVNASGCGTTIKDYSRLFADDPVQESARSVSSHALDISEFVRTLPLAPLDDGFKFRVAYHDPCSIRHGQKITEAPREILRKLGFRVLDVPEAHFCCGSAGTYNILHPEMAEALGQRKAAHVESTDPDIIATGNIGCMVQIARFTRLPVVHWVELADWATGGVVPAALENVDLRTPERSQSDLSNDAGSKPALGFW